MHQNHLRVFWGPREQQAGLRIADEPPAAATVSVPLSEVLPALADAVQSRRTWLSDFADEEISISTDLYEVLLAYQYYRRPSA